VVGQKISAWLIGAGMTGTLAAGKIQKTEIIPGFSEHAAEYALIGSITIGLIGAISIFVIGILNWLENKRYHNKLLAEKERHNRTEEAKG